MPLYFLAKVSVILSSSCSASCCCLCRLCSTRPDFRRTWLLVLDGNSKRSLFMVPYEDPRPMLPYPLKSPRFRNQQLECLSELQLAEAFVLQRLFCKCSQQSLCLSSSYDSFCLPEGKMAPLLQNCQIFCSQLEISTMVYRENFFGAGFANQPFWKTHVGRYPKHRSFQGGALRHTLSASKCQ